MDKLHVLGLLLCLALAIASFSDALQYEGTESQRGLSKLDFIELEYQADINGLSKDKETGESGESQSTGQQNTTVSGKSISFSLVDESESKATGDRQRKRMLDLIELEFEADVNGAKKPNLDAEAQAARKRMLDSIELEFEADVKGVKRPELDAGTPARKRMLDLIDIEFEADMKDHEQRRLDQAEKKQRGLSKLELIELEFEADINRHEQSKRDEKEQALRKEKRERMLDLIELEYESDVVDHHDFAFRGKSSSSAPKNPSGLKVLLNQLVENHKNGRVSSSSSSSSQTVSSEKIANLKEKFNALRGVSFRDLALRSDFDEILAAAAHLEEVNPARGYISRLAKYRTIIKEGIEASQRAPIAQNRVNLLKEMALEKQALADAEFAAAKALAEQDDKLYEKITALKEQLAGLESEKESVHRDFKDIAARLEHYLAEAAAAHEEYKAAVQNAKSEEAAQELGREAAEKAEGIWLKFLSSL